MFRLIFLTLALSGFANAALAQKRVPLDEVTDITLDDQGLAKLSVNLPEAGIIKALVFSGAEATFTLDATGSEATETEPAIAPLPVSAIALDRGEHIITTAFPDAPNTKLQVRFVHEPPLDRFEPNDTQETARRITPPFAGLVRFGSDDADWFEFDAPAGHLVGAQLRTFQSYSGPVINFYTSQGELLYQSPDENWGHRGMRYIVSPGGTIRINLSDTSGRTKERGGFIPLVVQTFPPQSESNSILVKLDLEADEDTSFQLNALGRAVGARVADADDAATIAAELNRAVSVEDKTPFPVGWAFLIALGLGIVGGIGILLRQQSANRSASAPSDT